MFTVVTLVANTISKLSSWHFSITNIVEMYHGDYYIKIVISKKKVITEKFVFNKQHIKHWFGNVAILSIKKTIVWQIEEIIDHFTNKKGEKREILNLFFSFVETKYAYT